MKKNIKSILEQNIIEQEILNDNCLYIKEAKESIVRIKAYFNTDYAVENISSNYIYTYMAMDEGDYQVETTKSGIAVIQENGIERRLVALYDAVNNISVSSYDYNMFGPSSMYYQIMHQDDKNLEKIKK